ncbi:GSK3-beta interaction protein [Neodiprion pinetum]|uniref:GSK3-beta interaction protein n=1 Tax=Neodiprion lecontei TaxID=441921 RepID=A0A6J0BA50_NEOLC|nr:GSK3-beta interaction protein [Neodiprion lecontei]XP_046428511.1 GSK3-beta interaction protein [Neodiprion fabricii]XP_046485568.1 GSK3-beta interaction protein [Neodiprion pinetum]
MESSEDKVFDKEQWKLEAEAVIADVKCHVKELKLSDKLPNTNNRVYLNLTTLEEVKYCVELSPLGFAVVDKTYDSDLNREAQYYETPYSLLNYISPEYTRSFGLLLHEKLSKITHK